MNTSFGDHLVRLWAEHKKRSQPESDWMTEEKLFRIRLKDSSREMFGDLTVLLEWEVKSGFGGLLRARAEIPGYTTTLEWTPDITGLYQFFAWSRGSNNLVKYHLDGRLKLGAILSGEEPYEADGPLGIGDEEEVEGG